MSLYVGNRLVCRSAH